MALIRHCIIDITTNTVVNIIEYETVKSGTADGLEEHLICVQSDKGQIGASYNNGKFVNPIPSSITLK